MHAFGLVDVVHERFVNRAQVVRLFENAWCEEGRCISLARGGYFLILLLEHFPFGIGEVERRSFDVLFPLLDILDDDLLGRVYGEGAGHVRGEVKRDAPGVHLAVVARVEQGARVDDLRVHHQVDALVVVDEAVGLASVDDGLAQVLFCGEHRSSNPRRSRLVVLKHA